MWGWFIELRNSVAGTDPLPYSEIAAWADLTRSCPTPVEVERIKLLDRVFVEVAMEQKNVA